MKKCLLLLCFLWLGIHHTKAQFSVADSAFLNSIFVENLYINNSLYSNDWFDFDSLGEVNDLFVQINKSYPFSDSMLLHAYSGIQFTGGIEYDTSVNARIELYNQVNQANLFGCRNPFVQLPFQLNGINGITNALLDTSSSLTPTGDAYIIVTGTGDNQLTRMAVSPNDYHNINCQVRYHVKTKGDVFIVGAANEDNRAIHFNKKKLGRYYPSMPTFLHNYLNNTQHSMGINRVIEIVAWIKYLKTKYNRVYVLGLSSGGTEALWASMLAQPKATMVSSGYSVLFDTDSTFQAINGYFYGNYMNYFVKDSVKKYISEGNTHYFFTHALGDLAIFQQDSSGNFTKSYYNGTTKVNFVSNYHHHAFPPCGLIDTFLQHIPLGVTLQNNNGPHAVCSTLLDDVLNLYWGDRGMKFIRLYDISGRCVLSTKSLDMDIRIDCGFLTSGVYILETQNRLGVSRQKLIKR